MLLKLALLSLIESIRRDPDKYTSLIYHNNTPSNTDCISQYYDTASYTWRTEQYPSQNYKDMLIKESEKLYTSLVKEWVDKIITDYTFSIASSSLALLSPLTKKNDKVIQ